MQENILRKIYNKFFIILFIIIFSFSNSYANQKWVIDNNISEISFEVPVLFATNFFGEFKNIEGYVEIDLENKKNNKAILSVLIESVETNYEKYRNILLGPIFFDVDNYPISVLDTKKFSYSNETNLTLDIELTIKGTSKIVTTDLKILKLTNEIVQILGTLEFSRTDFNIGSGTWSNTTILKDKITINSNIFLIKE